MDATVPNSGATDERRPTSVGIAIAVLPLRVIAHKGGTAWAVVLSGSLALMGCGKGTEAGKGSAAATGGGSAATGSAAGSSVGSNKPTDSPTGGTFARTLADYLAKKTPGVPCPVVGVAQELKVADWTIRVDSVTVNEAQSKLPLIQNVDERSIFGKKDRKGLVVQYSVRNDTPIKKPRDLRIEIHTSDGEVPPGGAYNADLFAKANGIPTTHGALAPNTFERFVAVQAAKVGATDDGAMWVRYSVSQIDPNDRSGRHTIEVIKAQGVIDLGKAAEGLPIGPNK